MNEFLFDVATLIHDKHKTLQGVTVVFPNHRSILYFRKHLATILTKPAFSPTLLTIEEFIIGFSTKKIEEKTILIYKLYEVYTEIMFTTNKQAQQSFSDFYYWGEMLLHDFDEIDKNLIDASLLFLNLSHQKEIDHSFDFLTEEQILFLTEFWGSFDNHTSDKKDAFIKVWNNLAKIYTTYKARLTSENSAYRGMIDRETAEKIICKQYVSAFPDYAKKSLAFVGFNALTQVEEKILSYFVEHHGADIFWDLDTYYFHHQAQEAGLFFREYKKHPILGKTFPDTPSSHIQNKIYNKAIIHAIGAPQPIGQAKVLAQLLHQQIIEQGMKPDETLIVLPDEKLLFPVLHSIPVSVNQLNVTMGFSLLNSPWYSFIELLFDLQLTHTPDGYHHRYVLALLQHSYIQSVEKKLSDALSQQIIDENRIVVPIDNLCKTNTLFDLIFKEVSFNNILSYLQAIIETIGFAPELDALDKEYTFHFYTFFNRLKNLPSSIWFEYTNPVDRQKNIQSFRRLFHLLVQQEKIPFAAEPLSGLQIMGMLETRNLDFKNVFILSLNEGSLPRSSVKGSYVPHSIRKAFGLPTTAHQDAMYAYLFYRLLQRSDTIHLLYNTETDTLGQGELSRFVQQLLYESGLNIYTTVAQHTVQPRAVQPIRIQKDSVVMENIFRFSKPNAVRKGIAPSALNTYLECRLKFYFRYVAGLKEPKKIEEDIDNRILGNFLHSTMERFYKKIIKQKGSSRIDRNDIENHSNGLDELISTLVKEKYRLSKKSNTAYTGQRFIVQKIVRRFAQRILESDKEYAPFDIEAIEHNDLSYRVAIQHPPYSIYISGVIDRVDRKENVLRIVDYKTGKDDLNFQSVESLFERTKQRNKAVFQTMFYALLYTQQINTDTGVCIQPGLMNRKNLFGESLQFGLRMKHEIVTNAIPLLPLFEKELKKVVDELFNPEEVFDQTTNPDNCSYCEFQSICYRG